LKKTIQKRQVTFSAPEFTNQEEEKDEANNVELDEAENNIINMDIDFGDVRKEEVKKDDEENEGGNPTAILSSNVSEEEWKREVERVSGKLKLEGTSNYTTGEWRGHIEQVKNYNVSFTKSIPDTRQILEKLSEDLDQNLEKISKKEGLISKKF